MKNRCAVVLTCLLVSSVLWASSSVVPSPRSTDPRAPTGTTLGAPIPAPDPDDPLIFRVQPTEAQQGQQVLIEGFNFGSAPQVTFNGTLASIVARRLDLAALVVLVPSGAVSGALIVTNTDTAEPSNPAEFVVAPGTYTPVCSIVGTITDNTMAAVVNAEVQALDPETGLFVGLDTSDASGNYSIGLAAAGEYPIRVKAPDGTSFVSIRSVVNCPGTLNHQFVVGSQLSGRLVENQIPYNPVPNALLFVWPSSGGGAVRIASDANGEFSFYLVDDTYDFFIIGPPGGRQIADYSPGLVVSGASPLGDIPLETGWILSGTAQYQDDSGTRPWNGYIELTDSQGGLAGYGYAIVDGNFWFAGQHGTNNTLTIGGSGAVNLEVQSIDLTTDTGLDHTLTVYSPDAQIPTLPTIIDADFLVLKQAQSTAFEGVNFSGSSVSVRFPDGVGGWVDGVDMHVDSVRSLIVTRVPALAVSGNVHIRVDGVDGPGYPLTIDPGVYDPGSYTVSGTVTDGSDPLEGVLVALLRIDCDDDILSDYDVTDAGGSYSVNHATGDYFLALLPPVPSGLPLTLVPLPNLTGNTISDATLEAGDNLIGRIVDSGIGPIGATSAPIRNCFIEAGGVTGAWEWVLTDASGLLSVHLVPGTYEIFIEGPQQSRYLTDYVSSATPADLGDVPLDSGYFIEGHVVNELGVGLPGVHVSARDTATWDRMGSVMTVGDTGWFRLAAPAGSYQIEFWMHDDLDYDLPIFEGVDVWTDTVLYPDFEAVPAGHIQGTIYLSDGVTPVPGAGVSVNDFDTGNWFGWTNGCADGTYDVRIGPGTYSVAAMPEDDPCLATEHYANTPYSCNAAPVAVMSNMATTGIDFTLEPGGSISGRVVDDWGSGVSDVSICVDEGPASPCSLTCTWPNGDGSYTLERVPVGVDHRVRATPWDYPEECWDDHIDCADYDPVPVNECLNSSGIDFTLSDTPGPVPDGHYVAGLPLTMAFDQLSQMLTLNWEPTCNADGHVLYYGTLGQYGVYTSAVCDIGMTGSVTVLPPSHDVFFLVAGRTRSTEGSYGLGSGWVERPAAGGAHCGYTQDLSHSCMP
jgi:hypothetical protein